MGLSDTLATGASSMLSNVLGAPSPTPQYRISLDGVDITSRFNSRLLSLQLTDNRGLEADTLELTLDDSDTLLAIPPRGASLDLALGWAGTPLVEKGRYVVQSIEHAGPPYALKINAASANLAADLATKKERSWNAQTIGDIVKSIAGEHALEARISAKLSGILIAHVDQTGESDMNLLSRLAQQHDAIATIKNGVLLFIPTGEAQTASGTALPTMTLARSVSDTHKYSLVANQAEMAVKATWQDTLEARPGKIIISAEGSTEGTADVETSIETQAGKNIRVLRHLYANRETAHQAAQAEWRRIQRGAARLELTCALARPELFPETPVTVRGFKPEIDAEQWLVSQCVHSLSAKGFQTALVLELATAETTATPATAAQTTT